MLTIHRHILSVSIAVVMLFGSAAAQSHYALSWEKDGIFAGVGLATAITGYTLDHGVKPLTLQDINSLNRDNINSFDRGATFKWSEKLGTASDVVVALALAAPLSLAFMDNSKADYKTLGFMYGEVLGFTYFTCSIAKGSAQRVRPYAYNADVPIDKKLEADTRKSFFSSHTAAAFASMSFLSTVFIEYNPHSKYTPYIVGGGLLTAAAVGVLRIESGNHFPSDVITGAVVGTIIGYVIPYMHQVNEKNMSLVPTLENQSPGFSFTLVF